MSAILPQVYDASTDTVVPVTQQWCDNAQKALNMQHKRHVLLRAVAQINVASDGDKLKALEEVMDRFGFWR